ncbi:MAG: PaaI family thioesterase [Desulfobacterales bacterium]|nr:PaaI family thioesterase [Desulfobacterales bacterium]
MLKPIKSFYEDRGCFGCGADNPNGLHMEFAADGEQVVSRLTVPAHLCGWDNIIHGGIVSTIHDEIMSWTAIQLLRKMILTKSVKVDFLKPLFTGRELEARGRVHTIVSEREAIVESTIFDNAGCCCSKGRGTFALITPEFARKQGLISEKAIRSFENYKDWP